MNQIKIKHFPLSIKRNPIAGDDSLTAEADEGRPIAEDAEKSRWGERERGGGGEGVKSVSPSPALPLSRSAVCGLLIIGMLVSCWAGCASTSRPPLVFPDVRVVSLAVPTGKLEEPFEQVKDRWTARLEVPDPLFGSPTLPAPMFKGSRGRIRIEATLYGPEMIEAELFKACADDSLSEAQCAERRAEYAERHHTQKWFRIALRLHSGYEEKSLDADLWTIYLVDDKDIMYEPVAVKSDSVEKVKRKIYSEFHNMTMERMLFSRNVDLYFPKITFFGKALLDEGNRSLKLILARHKRTVGEAEWHFYP